MGFMTWREVASEKNPVTIGRIVHFTVDEYTAEQIKKAGLPCNGNKADDILPALVVRVWGPEMVNLQVFVDGGFTVWVTSVGQGRGPRSWHYAPQLVKENE